MRFCSIFGAVFAEIIFYVPILPFYKTRRFAVFRNFRVISMLFAVFLCYSVRCLYVFLYGFSVFVRPLRPPSGNFSNIVAYFPVFEFELFLVIE